MAEEEIYLDSWEEQADSGILDKRLEEMSIDIQAKETERKKQIQSLSSAATNVLVDESGKTQYQPQVRILQREPKTSSSPTKNHKNNLSLAWAYSASLCCNDLLCLEDPVLLAELNKRKHEFSDNCLVVKWLIYHRFLSPYSSPQIIKPDNSFPRVSVIRQPKGPDGTTGFNKPDLT
uniref:SUZ-C domain-containing protein n=1 Tax=Biomphalaria glabrata TaxID=6526 RepID=A0A2C9KLF3_BIOGL